MRSVNDLSHEEIGKLLDANQSIHNMVWEAYLDQTDEMVRDSVLWAFEHKGNRGVWYSCDYEISYNGAWMVVQQCRYGVFIEDCLRIQEECTVFKDSTMELLKKLKGKSEEFADGLDGWSDLSDTEWNALEKEFDDGVDTIINEILKYCRSEYDAVDDPENLKEFASEYWDEWNADMEVDEDGVTVWKTIIKKYT